jgi:hypothetical protein
MTRPIRSAPEGLARLIVELDAGLDLDLAIKRGAEIQSYGEKERGGDFDAPTQQFAAAFPIMWEIWSSWEVSPEVHRKRLQDALASMTEVGRIISQDDSGARREAAMYDWTEVFRGDAVVRDVVTGEEGTANVGWINETVNALNEAAGYPRYEHVPLREWWQGH